MHRLFVVFLLVLFLTINLFSDVTGVVTDDGLTASVVNNTDNYYTMGGVRFLNEGFQWEQISSGFSHFVINNSDIDGKNLVELHFLSKSAAHSTNLNSGETETFKHNFAFNPIGTDVVDGSIEVLLKTSYPGLPDNVIGEYSFTINQVDSVSKHSDFYNQTYRYSYIDGLGAKGGEWAAGFLDTWIGETQLLFAIPKNGFTISNTLQNFSYETNFGSAGTFSNNHYWIALAMGQEYFNVDMQFMAAQGAKESGIGTNRAISESSLGAAYGFWQLETSSALDRALCFPHYFPKYQSVLESAVDITSSGIDQVEFCNFYMRNSLGKTPVNSALVFNSLFFGLIANYSIYSIYSYAQDICWKEAVSEAVDPYLGPSAILPAYNKGLYSIMGEVSGLLNPNVYSATAANSNAGNLFNEGVFNYRPEIVLVMDSLTSASSASLTDPAIELIDFEITLDLLKDMFFGDGGTVNNQGDGGLLLHFWAEDDVAKRQMIWDTLSASFDLLKGKAPSVSANTISYRYDLLTVLRSVKTFFPAKNKMKVSGDAGSLVPQYSSGSYGTCNGDSIIDEQYPNQRFSIEKDSLGNITIIDTVIDNNHVKSLAWSMDYDWNIWSEATVIDSISDSMFIYSAKFSKSEIDYYRSFNDGHSGFYVWLMATDTYGNSAIKKDTVPYDSLSVSNIKIEKIRTAFKTVFFNNKKGIIRIALDKNSEVNIGIYNMLGKRVFNSQKKSVGIGVYQISLPSLSKGVYLADISINEKMFRIPLTISNTN